MIHLRNEIAGMVIDLVLALNKAERGHTCEVAIGDIRVRGRVEDTGTVVMEWLGLERPVEKRKSPSKPKP